MDHGFSTPYDLEALRSKVESRFESVDKLSKGKSKKKETNKQKSNVLKTDHKVFVE